MTMLQRGGSKKVTVQLKKTAPFRKPQGSNQDNALWKQKTGIVTHTRYNAQWNYGI